MSVFVIAEAGVNHGGSLERALALVDAAAAARADAVKFQTFRATALVTAQVGKAAYQQRATGEGTQLDMLRGLELNEDAHRMLLERCVERGIEFMSSPFDHESLDMLLRLGVKRLKLGSGEITNGPLLHAAAQSRLPLLMSTGMATMDEVREAVALTQDGGAVDITVLQYTTEYPAPPSEVNLRAMDAMRLAIGVPVGYSDHTDGLAVALAAVALGASVIEKHFTMDRSLHGPDHAASLEPNELARLVAGIRDIEAALGDGVKRPTASEALNRPFARKSLVAAAPVSAGEAFSASCLAVKRPGTGISPMRYWDLLGRPASRDYMIDELIDQVELSGAAT